MSEPIVIAFSVGDDEVGYCHSCDQLIGTGTIDANGRFCCGICGDFLEFACDDEPLPAAPESTKEKP